MKKQDIRYNFNDKDDQDMIENVIDYRSTYISDAISGAADGAVGIYWSDLADWLKTNSEWANEANAEFGPAKDIFQQLQQGQFLQNERHLYNNLHQIALLYAFDKIGKDEIPDDLADEIESKAQCFERWDEIDDLIEQYNNKED